MNKSIKRWWCSFWGHSIDNSKRHLRIKNEVGHEFEDGHERRYRERYSVCKRCGEEIMYIRFTYDSWITEEEVTERLGTSRNVGKWLRKEDADQVSKEGVY